MSESIGAPPGADVEFFWDPVCPWAWITSRWVNEVAEQLHLSVDWRFISLRLLNRAKDYEKDFAPGYVASHGTGLKLLRVAAAIRERDGREKMGELYTRFGTDLHVSGRRDELIDHYDAGFPDYLRSVGIAEPDIAAANDDHWDAVLLSETDEALSRTGKEVGTPIITFHGERGTQSFFGPVISRIPRGEEAVRLWNAIWEVATFPGFAELKRSLRERPQTS